MTNGTINYTRCTALKRDVLLSNTYGRRRIIFKERPHTRVRFVVVHYEY